MVSMVKNLLQLQLDSRTPSFSLHVLCKQLNWQIDTIMQICSALMLALSIVKRLTLDFNKHRMPTKWQYGAVDGMMWHKLLRPFVGAVVVILRATTKQGKVIMTPPMVGSTWPRVRSTLESDCLPALSQGTASFRLVVD